jgi:hypothetical protein
MSRVDKDLEARIEAVLRRSGLYYDRDRGVWCCRCAEFARKDTCRHVVPYRHTRDVSPREEYL